MRVGVLGVQGAIEEHLTMLACLIGERNVVRVKNKQDLARISGLIIPGGESTVISRLMISTGLFDLIRKRGVEGMPILGTCAGLIVLAKQGDEQVKQTGQKLLGLMDTKIKRNAFGRQKDSFEAALEIPVLGKEPFTGVFIRAPIVQKILDKRKVEVLARFKGKIVGVQQGNILATAFHPELSGDTRMHEYFLELL